MESIKISEDLIYEQFQDEFLQEKDQLRKRKHSSKRASFSNLNIPTDVSEMTDLLTVLKSLKLYIDTLSSEEIKSSKTSSDTNSFRRRDIYQKFFEVGKFVRVKWSKEEVGESGWRRGWFTAKVQGCPIKDDRITAKYLSEPESIYDMEVTLELAKRRLKLCLQKKRLT